MARGQQCLFYVKGKVETPLPLLDDYDHKHGETSYLANWDYFTMRFANEEALLAHYRSLDVIKNTSGKLIIKTKPTASRPRPNPIPVAYHDDYLLLHALQLDSNKPDVYDPYTQRFVHNFINDLKSHNGRIASLLLFPPTKKNQRNPYIDSFIQDYVREFLYDPKSDPYEQGQKMEEEALIGNRLENHLLDDYKRLRGIYFFYKKYKELVPNHPLTFDQLQHELAMEQKAMETSTIITPTTFDEDPDREPYFIVDEFDHPEAPIPDLSPKRYIKKMSPTPRKRKMEGQLDMESLLSGRDPYDW